MHRDACTLQLFAEMPPFEKVLTQFSPLKCINSKNNECYFEKNVLYKNGSIQYNEPVMKRNSANVDSVK